MRFHKPAIATNITGEHSSQRFAQTPPLFPPQKAIYDLVSDTKYMFLGHILQESTIRNALEACRQTVQGVFRPIQKGVEYERYQLKMEKVGK